MNRGVVAGNGWRYGGGGGVGPPRWGGRRDAPRDTAAAWSAAAVECRDDRVGAGAARVDDGARPRHRDSAPTTHPPDGRDAKGGPRFQSLVDPDFAQPPPAPLARRWLVHGVEPSPPRPTPPTAALLAFSGRPWLVAGRGAVP